MSTNQGNLVASFAATERVIMKLSMNCADGPHTHLSACCKAHSTGGAVKQAYPHGLDINGVSVVEGDIYPEKIEIELRAIDANVERLIVRAYPYRGMATLSSLELYGSITSSNQSNNPSGLCYSNTYKPEVEVFQGVDWFELVRNEDGHWELFALAGSDISANRNQI